MEQHYIERVLTKRHEQIDPVPSYLEQSPRYLRAITVDQLLQLRFHPNKPNVEAHNIGESEKCDHDIHQDDTIHDHSVVPPIPTSLAFEAIHRLFFKLTEKFLKFDRSSYIETKNYNFHQNNDYTQGQGWLLLRVHVILQQ